MKGNKELSQAWNPDGRRLETRKFKDLLVEGIGLKKSKGS